MKEYKIIKKDIHNLEEMNNEVSEMAKQNWEIFNIFLIEDDKEILHKKYFIMVLEKNIKSIREK